jgi:2-keto-4-pentenoate hydratase/2-oxohepta-3-ene-1,7-dioic acid hydratase in catechol pathway
LKLVCVWWGGRLVVGSVTPDGRDLQPLAIGAARGVLELVEHLAAGGAMPAPSGPRLPLSAVQLDAPLPRQRRNLFCIGRNYRSHAAELAGSVFAAKAENDSPWPMVFSKVPETVLAPGASVPLPRGISEQIDYEAELAVVIGRGGKNIPASRAMEHVFGYTIVDDVTARDVQMRHGQWHLGKSFDGFCPMGPWIVTADECDGTATRLRCWVNGELRQDANTRDLIFGIPALIEHCSRGITLQPGDVIATGTPAGVGMAMTPPRWLRAGDVVRIEIDGIGILEHGME